MIRHVCSKVKYFGFGKAIIGFFAWRRHIEPLYRDDPEGHYMKDYIFLYLSECVCVLLEQMHNINMCQHTL